jgi:hypothetical protein
MATPTSLPATFVAGNVLTAAQMNNLRGSFRVLQFLSAATTTDQTFSGGFTDLTGASLTITPQSTDSKIAIFFSANGIQNTTNSFNKAQILRGATALHEPMEQTHIASYILPIALDFVDSPATTSATTYKIQMSRSAGTYTNYNFQFIVMEISL